MTDVPVDPLQGRMFSSPAQLAAEGAADALRDAVAARVAALGAVGADPMTIALLNAAAVGVEGELRGARRPGAIAAGIKLVMALLSACGAPYGAGGDDDDEWLAELTRAAQVRNAPHS